MFAYGAYPFLNFVFFKVRHNWVDQIKVAFKKVLAAFPLKSFLFALKLLKLLNLLLFGHHFALFTHGGKKLRCDFGVITLITHYARLQDVSFKQSSLHIHLLLVFDPTTSFNA